MHLTEQDGIPFGLGCALAENDGALRYFAKLSAQKRREVIAHSRTVCSRAEMRAASRLRTASEMRDFVRSLGASGTGDYQPISYR